MIPVLDHSDRALDPARFADRLGRACRETGFFLLTGHPVRQELVERTFAMGDALFALPEEDKAPLDIAQSPHNRGWVRKGAEALDDAAGTADRKEAFNIGLDLDEDDPRVVAGEPFRGVNVWPKIDGFRDTLTAYFDAVQRLGQDLLCAVATDMALGERYFAPHFDAPMSTLRLLSYPPGTGAEGEIGAGAHTDYGALTLLMTDGEGGLQVRQRGGGWIDAPHVPGAFVVNIGDCLMRWTNGRYVSTPHRVLPPKRRRRSIAFFLDPNPDAMVAALPGTGPARWPAVTAADYLRSRLDATYGAGA
ncbi:isopenicillin N synthase family oxygenase [Rhodobacteraceae bacterium CCMM004]|nr:isopenicillin N synthase family oxygenase [Rhodobacteraceae bacterium CCMM004]